MPAKAAASRSVPAGKQPRNPISRKQVESVISRSVAVFGIVFGAQTVPAMLGQLSHAEPLWAAVMVTAVFASLIVALIASIAKRWVRQAHSLVSLVYLVALVSWPFAVLQTNESPSTNHWLYYLLTVATATASIGFSTRNATIYLFVVPAIYGIIRATPAGGGADWQQCILDSIYAIILGGAVMIIVTMLRQAAASVDAAQATALDRYAHAVRQHATEVERVQVDSIVHDSVLTTLLSAARAYTPEAKALAATMAGNAIGHLRSAAVASPVGDTTIQQSALAVRIISAARALTAPFELLQDESSPGAINAQTAEAVYSASVQAMVNSLQHAGPTDSVSRWLHIRGDSRGFTVVVGDDGRGFDLETVPTARLGVRVSIVERVTSAGGEVSIDSELGEGTIVTITCPNQSDLVRDSEEEL